MEVARKDAERFHEAVGALIRTSQAFPSIAAVLAEMDRSAAMQRSKEPAITEGEYWEMGRRNAARLAIEGLPSDGMLRRKGGARIHVVGSKEHQGWVHMYDRMIQSLELRLALREEEARERPHDTDLQRRIGVLVRTLGETTERREHFARTGETLPMGGLVSA